MGRKNPTPSSISNTELIDGVVPLNANGPLCFGPNLNLDHSSTEGHLVYDLLVADDEEEIKMVAGACSPRPVARFPSPTGCRAFAASGGAVLGASYDFWDTVFHDTVMQVGGYGF